MQLLALGKCLVMEDLLGHSCLQEGERHRQSQLQANLSW